VFYNLRHFFSPLLSPDFGVFVLTLIPLPAFDSFPPRPTPCAFCQFPFFFLPPVKLEPLGPSPLFVCSLSPRYPPISGFPSFLPPFPLPPLPPVLTRLVFRHLYLCILFTSPLSVVPFITTLFAHARSLVPPPFYVESSVCCKIDHFELFVSRFPPFFSSAQHVRLCSFFC